MPHLPHPTPSRALRVLIALFALSFAIGAPGCSIILSTHASRIRDEFPWGMRVPRDQMAKINPGAHVDFVLARGDSVRGTFRGTDVIDAKQYEAMYEAWRTEHAAQFPKFGSRIVLTRTGEKSITGKFVGFGWRSVLLPDSDHKVEEIPFAAFDGLQAGDFTFATAVLTEMRLHGAPPCRTGVLVSSEQFDRDSSLASLAVDEGTGVRLVSADAVDEIVIRRAIGSPVVYLLAGLAIDAAVVYAIASQPHHSSQQNCGPSELPGGWYPYSYRPAGVDSLGSDFDTRTAMPVAEPSGDARPRAPAAAAP